MTTHVKLTRVADLIHSKDQSPDGRRPEFYGVANFLGGLWAYGSDVFWFSRDGSHWKDLAALLDLENPFAVKSVFGTANGLFVFVRDRDGMHCFCIDPATWKCSRLPSVPSESPGALPANGPEGLLICVNEGHGAEFWHFRNSQRTWEKLPQMLAGAPTFLQVKPSGEGICALWGITSEDGFRPPEPSAIYQTRDFGASWSKIQQVHSMLLHGAASESLPAILGGSLGFIGEQTSNGFKQIYGPCSDDFTVVALCTQNSHQAATLESSHEPPRQTLLCRSKQTDWQQFDLGSLKRIQGMAFVRFGAFLLCSRHELLVCQLDLLH